MVQFKGESLRNQTRSRSPMGAVQLQVGGDRFHVSDEPSTDVFVKPNYHEGKMRYAIIVNSSNTPPPVEIMTEGIVTTEPIIQKISDKHTAAYDIDPNNKDYVAFSVMDKPFRFITGDKKTT